MPGKRGFFLREGYQDDSISIVLLLLTTVDGSDFLIKMCG